MSSSSYDFYNINHCSPIMCIQLQIPGQTSTMATLSRDEIKKLSPSELCSHLVDALGDGVSGSVLDTLEEQGLSGEFFLELAEDDLRELAPRMGDRMALRRYINSFKVASAKVR